MRKVLRKICIEDTFEKFISVKNWFMLSVRISSYGCTREVWRARKKRKGNDTRFNIVQLLLSNKC